MRNAITIPHKDQNQQDYNLHGQFEEQGIKTIRLLKGYNGETYDVSLHPDGRVTCTCADFIYRSKTGREPSMCKHGRACLFNGLFDDAVYEEVNTIPDPAVTAAEIRQNELEYEVPAARQLTRVKADYGAEYAAKVDAELKRLAEKLKQLEEADGDRDEHSAA